MTLKINRVRLLVISIMYTKFDGPSWNGSVCIVFTSFVDKPTDTQTDAQTDAPYHNTSRQVGCIKRVAPYRCLDGHVKEPYEISMASGARP